MSFIERLDAHRCYDFLREFMVVLAATDLQNFALEKLTGLHTQ